MLTRPKTLEERLAELATTARPDFNPWHGNPEDRPLPSRAFYAFRDATSPVVILALTAVAEAAREVRRKHPGNGESADLVLDRALAALDHQEGSW